MPFAQLIVGAPGSGKSTYCDGMQQLMSSGLGRNVKIINLDPANESPSYEPDIDIQELITVQDAMSEFSLGPNGGLMYCMRFLEENIDWLNGKIRQIEKWDKCYFLLDLPGQVELFTESKGTLSRIISDLEKSFEMRFCIVNLVDSTQCADASRFIAAVMLSLRMMLCLEYPFISLLSKIDLVEAQDKLPFDLEFYTELHDLSYLLEQLNQGPFTKKFSSLNAKLCELIEEFGLVSFYPLYVEDKTCMLHALKAIDKANGLAFSTLEDNNQGIMDVIAGNSGSWRDDLDRIQETYMRKTAVIPHK